MPFKLTVQQGGVGSVNFKVNEGSDATLEFDARDDAGTSIPVADIESATLTLSVKGKGTIINSRNEVDVKTYFNAEGHFSFVLTPADNVIVSEARSLAAETHLITISFLTAAPSSKTFREQMTFEVANLEKIPAA